MRRLWSALRSRTRRLRGTSRRELKMCVRTLRQRVVDRRMQGWRRNITPKSASVASRIAACAFVAACGANGISHAQSGILPNPIPIPVEREWYYEHEFALTPGLRAQPRHAILLKLEHGDSKDKTVVNSIPYRVPEDRTFDLCVPKDDPYIRSMTLMSEDGRNVVVQVLDASGATEPAKQ